ncbi:MAG: ATP-binding protein [Lachnospiraceae bacterium]
MGRNKRFNTTGTCIPSLHYMADTTGMIDQIIEDYIEQGEYFTMNRARQYGKTTTLELLYQKLKDRYIVIDISFEAADEYFQSLGTFARGLVMDIADCLRAQEVSEDLCRAWETPVSEEFPLRDFGKKITALCRKSDREAILIIDEVDKNADNQIFLTFLGMLREKYLRQRSGRDHTFRSVILAGVYDIKNLKLRMHGPEESKYNSPWNIAADFNVDMSLTEEGICRMLYDYEQDWHTGMDIKSISRQIYSYTSGYPFLVSRLCKLLDEQVAGSGEFPDRSAAWTSGGFQEAVKRIVYESNTLFDDVRKKLDEYPGLSKIIYVILFNGKNIAYTPDNLEIEIGIRFGFLRCIDGQAAVANRIYEMRFYNYFLGEEMAGSNIYSASMRIKNQFIHGKVLDMELILRKFVEHFTDIYGDSTDRFVEENGRRLFLLYIKPIINGTGNYYIEARTRSMGRTDVIVDYLGRQYIVEMKIYHGNEYNLRGENQLMGYLKDYHLQKGYMLSFNFNKKKQVGVREVALGDKVIIEAIV